MIGAWRCEERKVWALVSWDGTRYIGIQEGFEMARYLNHNSDHSLKMDSLYDLAKYTAPATAT